jgi:hypothetical protein
MQFHLALDPKAFPEKIAHEHSLFLIGSCFTEQIGAKLRSNKFEVIDNPNGILFNPISIAHALAGYLKPKHYTTADLFERDGLWGSWDHHTRFSRTNPNESVELINQSQQLAHTFLQKANWLLITLGSAFGYERTGSGVVANCHKVPADQFQKRLFTSAEIVPVLKEQLAELRRFNPGIRIIFTISPVRHLRDGFVENNRSKAQLITAVHALCEELPGCYYFPAYELVIDDLRDYRFYAEDLVHPNYAATNYVWEKFRKATLSVDAELILEELHSLLLAYKHRPANPDSEQHRLFMRKQADRCTDLMARYPHIDLHTEYRHFTGNKD